MSARSLRVRVYRQQEYWVATEPACRVLGYGATRAEPVDDLRTLILASELHLPRRHRLLEAAKSWLDEGLNKLRILNL